MTARIHRLKLSSNSQLVIALRPYRSNKEARLAASGVATFPTYLSLRPTKEIAFYIEKPARQADLQRFSLVPFIMIFIGLAGIVNFSAQTKKTSEGLTPVASFSVPVSEVKKSEKAGLEPSEPIHISVPAAHVDAPVQPVGQNKDKTIEVPPLFENITGWYKLGPTPGEIGPAVIVGHVDTYKGPSVFFYLKEMKPGQVIEIKRKDGKVVKFKVTALKQFSQDKFPTDEVYGNIDHAGLRLITCGGTFNEKTQQYSANTVVFATLIDEKT